MSAAWSRGMSPTGWTQRRSTTIFSLSPPPPPPYDDAFALRDGRVGIHWPGALRLVCHSDCRYVVVFDERPGLLCVEPQTALPDGINAAPGLVRPGVPRTARAVWSWSPG